MRVFVTGATGWIGSAIVKDLLSSGHKVTGLTTTPDGARRLQALGAEARVGRLHNHALLREGAAESDGVIHLAFIHGLANMSLLTRLRLFAGVLNGGIVQSFLRILAETESGAIQALGAGLENSKRPFVVASGILSLPQGKVSTERDDHVADRSKPVILRDRRSGPDCTRRPFFNRAASPDRAWRGRARLHDPNHCSGAQQTRFALYWRRRQPMAGGACVGRRAPLSSGA
jgi:hypothetical protein